MYWKNKMYLSVSLLMASLAFAASAVLVGSGVFTAAESAEAVSVSYVNENAVRADGFILKEYQGYIAIFAPGFDKTPATITGIEVKNLREADKELLKNGIHAETSEELMLLLEDFGS